MPAPNGRLGGNEIGKALRRYGLPKERTIIGFPDNANFSTNAEKASRGPAVPANSRGETPGDLS